MGAAFFSYSRVDSDFALKLAKDLRNAGVDLWIDQIDIKPGSHWDASIETALNAADSMIIILSPDSIASHNVMDEVSYALEGQKRVIPILWKECTPPFRLRRLQRINFTGDYKSGFDHLMEALDPGTRQEEPRFNSGSRNTNEKTEDDLFLEQFSKAKACLEKEEFDASEKYIIEALKIKPGNNEAVDIKTLIEQSRLFLEQFEKARVYYGKGKDDDAERYINEALKIKPSDKDALEFSALIGEARKMAAQLARDAASQESERLFKDHVGRARLNFERTDYKAAKKHADDALRIKPGNKEVLDFINKTGIEGLIKKQKRNRVYIYAGLAVFLVGLSITIILLRSNSGNSNSDDYTHIMDSLYRDSLYKDSLANAISVLPDTVLPRDTTKSFDFAK